MSKSRLERWDIRVGILVGMLTLIGGAYKLYGDQRDRRAAFVDNVQEVRSVAEALRDSMYGERIYSQLENFEVALQKWDTLAAPPPDIRLIPEQIVTNRADVQALYIRLQQKIDALELAGDGDTLGEIAALMERVRINSKGMFDHAFARFSDPEHDMSDPEGFAVQKARWAEISATLRSLLRNETQALLNCVDDRLGAVIDDRKAMQGTLCKAEREAYLARHAAILRQ
ncbi:hypothetical protein [Algicella marina]|uniref:Uncharacterized protein n=1 Tax=Algicella marina TaxID=2683284 RepID=A0A6P1SUV1_9RHOB|nr:hypothetical protein [Algicella marina]QHQ34228.1 hypothetical protein GO499_02990 [Algicella marina]